MALGHKTGGRAPGTPNKRTQEAAQILDELGCNPICGMAEIAMSKSHPIELRARMFMGLAHYVYPKRKAVAVSVAEPEAREQATSDDIIRWLDEKAERVQGNLAREPGKKLMELLEKTRLPILPALNGADSATNGPGVEHTLGEPVSAK